MLAFAFLVILAMALIGKRVGQLGA
jgi:hypothetical protein